MQPTHEPIVSADSNSEKSAASCCAVAEHTTCCTVEKKPVCCGTEANATTFAPAPARCGCR
jgi:hypothetical protein